MSETEPITPPEDPRAPWGPQGPKPFEVTITLCVDAPSAQAVLLELAEALLRVNVDMHEVDVHVERAE